MSTSTATDREVIARHMDKASGELAYFEDASERLRAELAEFRGELEPLDESILSWPVGAGQFRLTPANILKGVRPEIVFLSVSPGRWRLKATASCDTALPSEETVVSREIVLGKDGAPLEIALPACALAGTIDNPVSGIAGGVTTVAVPRQPGRPTRTCCGTACFRFIGLEPGEYTLEIRAEGCEDKRLTGVVVEKGKATWLEKVPLKRAAPAKEGPVDKNR